MNRKLDHEQLTIRLEREDVAKANELTERLAPLIKTRADLLRLACHIGLETIDKMKEHPLTKRMGSR